MAIMQPHPTGFVSFVDSSAMSAERRSGRTGQDGLLLRWLPGLAQLTTVLLTAPLSVHQVMINGHAICPPLSFARSCDPCRPGTAVQVERPQRSERCQAAGWNNNPKPFVWHKTADESLETLAASCQRIPDFTLAAVTH